jgi:F-type H+-transporting ATPase subunit b
MNKSLRFLIFVMYWLAVTAPVFAAEGGEESPVESPLGWAFRIINFAILFGGLLYLLVSKAPAFFKGRAAEIVSAITEAKRVKDEADEMLAEAQSKLARLDQEIAELRVAAKEDGAAEAERIRTMAREEEAKVGRAAQAEIDAAERAARMELRALAAQLAVERAEVVVKGRMTPEAQSALVRAFVENLGRAN